jgi:hypothetical protein
MNVIAFGTIGWALPGRPIDGVRRCETAPLRCFNRKDSTMTNRKTIEVATVKTLANQYFSESRDEERDGRCMLFTFVESLLFKTGQYKGFGYINGKGVIHNANGEGKHEFPDDSRVILY